MRRDRNSQKGRGESHSRMFNPILKGLRGTFFSWHHLWLIKCLHIQPLWAMRPVCEDMQINGHVGSPGTHWGSQQRIVLEKEMVYFSLLIRNKRLLLTSSFGNALTMTELDKNCIKQLGPHIFSNNSREWILSQN